MVIHFIWVPSMYMALMISLTLGYTVVRLECYLWRVYGYTTRWSHKKILLCQNFFPGRRECRIIFYIFLAYGSHGGWSKAIITLMMILFEQRHYVMVHVMVHHLKLLWWFIEGVSYEPLIRNTTFFLQDLWQPSVVKATFIYKCCEDCQQLSCQEMFHNQAYITQEVYEQYLIFIMKQEHNFD